MTSSVQRMPGPADTLDRTRNPFRRRNHHDQIDRADVDSELEAGRTNDRPQFSILQTIFDLKPNTAIERSMMDFDRVRQFRKVLAQSQADLFRGGADIGENYHRLARTNQLRQFRVKTSTGVAGRWIRIAPDRRKNVYDLFFLHTRFRDPTTAAHADKKLGQRVERRSRRRKTDPANGWTPAHPIAFAAHH